MTTVVRYEKNPFLEDMIIPTKNRSVRLNKLGKGNNVLINQSTGEFMGTHVTTYRKVDSDQFIKIFTQNIALTFNLDQAGIKAFSILAWAVQNTAVAKDQVQLDSITLKKFLEFQENKNLKLSLSTFRKGVSSLEKNKIIAKCIRPGDYFINPNFVFNGDRIAFTNVIEREKD